ncbi:hypothetical protein [Zoogloea sp.]|uniref:hypothetical protein n=1 Tax=Zoogloea sp. TaxID=49181 RepID=UPI0035B0F73B
MAVTLIRQWQADGDDIRRHCTGLEKRAAGRLEKQLETGKIELLEFPFEGPCGKLRVMLLPALQLGGLFFQIRRADGADVVLTFRCFL